MYLISAPTAPTAHNYTHNILLDSEGAHIDDRRFDFPQVARLALAAGRAQLKFGRLNDKGYWYTAAGIVKEIPDRGVTRGDRPGGIVVRTAVEPGSIVSAVRQAIRSVEPGPAQLASSDS